MLYAQYDALVPVLLMLTLTVHTRAKAPAKDPQPVTALLPATAAANVSEHRYKLELAKLTTAAIPLLCQEPLHAQSHALMLMQMHMDHMQAKEYAKDPQLVPVLLLVTAAENELVHKCKPDLAKPTMDVVLNH